MTDAAATGTVNNPFFARVWTTLSAHEPESIRRLRRENLAGLTGRVLEVGAGTGTNFEFYPAAVTEVVAIEPEVRLAVLARQAAEKAPIRITVSTDTVERYVVSATGQPFDAVVCSLVLCSVDDPDTVLRQLFSALRPGGELRYLEHVASTGPRAGMQRLADATVWPRLFGNCHTHRHTEQYIADAGFEVGGARHEWVMPAWVPMPGSETAIGRAVKPA
jgi:SAM-dependent methyltransferase